MPPVPPRRLLLLSPLALLACAREPPQPPRPRLEGYAWLTPLRLNVASLEVAEPPPGPLFRADPPAPLSPLGEVLRMGRDRLSASGTSGRALFRPEAAVLLRERDRMTLVLRARVEVLDGERPVAFALAEARGLASGDVSARAAEALVARAMEELNVEFEVQLRRSLRDWLLDTVPAAPPEPAVRREALPPA